jgi:hypothetical protein
MPTLWQYLKRPPLRDLLAIIFAALAVHLGLGTLIWLLAPRWPWWLAYGVSATGGISTAAALALHLCGRRRRER